MYINFKLEFSRKGEKDYEKIRKIMEIIVMVYVFAIAMGSSLPAEASTKLATPKVTVAKTSSNSVAIKWKKIGSAKNIIYIVLRMARSIKE